MKKFICAVTAALFLTAFLPFAASADVFDSFSDGDLSGGGYSGGDYSGSSGGNFVFFGGSSGDGDISPAGVIIVIAVVVAVSYISLKKANRVPRQGGAQTPVYDENSVVEKIRQNDPGFSLSEFKSFASDSFVAVQEAWESQDAASVAPIVSEKLLRMLETFSADYKNKGQKNHLDFQNVKSLCLTNFTADGANEVLTVKVQASLVDYVTDEAGNTVRGSETERHCRTYRIDFIRTAGSKTKAAQDGARVCPSCGAAVTVAGTGRCEYCGCILTAAEYGWVMNSYGEWR